MSNGIDDYITDDPALADYTIWEYKMASMD